MKRDTLDALLEARRKGVPCALVRDLKSGAERWTMAVADTSFRGPFPP